MENKMGTMPIRRLIIHMSWPMMLSMLVQALYNMVDSYFVSLIDDSAFVALGLAYPAQTMMVAICVGTGVGVNAMLSRRLGEKKPEAACAVALNGYFLYLLSWVVFLLFGLTLGPRFVGFFNSDPLVREYGGQYLTIVTVFSLGVCMQFAGERVLQATGNAVGPMIIQGVGAVVNLFLDPVLIFGLGPFPALGVAGAAIATVFGQLVGMAVGFVLVARNRVIRLTLRGFRPCPATILDIYRIGGPAIVMQSLSTVMTLGLNKILSLPKMLVLYGDAPVFILSAYFKLQSFVFMPVYGMNNGLTPILSYNYGARQRERIAGGVRFALAAALCIMGVGMVIFLLFPWLLMGIFSAPELAMAMGVPALRIISLSFLFAGVSIILGAAFQALGVPMFSLILSVLRQAAIVLPVCLFFVFTAPELVWWCLPVAEAVSCAVALVLYRWVYHAKILPLGAAS
ncbi:MATE family efflux transporter [Pseudoflavonifractor intestinihominis]|uniref:Probable multidrug resistance protein NorM n=1 Tax=Pseudoflavonifractor intestinihominis TaxID=3133171 RepID=A0ABV1E4P6_9FIRM